MDLLKTTDGFSLIETLVGITIFGLLVGFTALFFLQIFQNPKMLIMNEASILAHYEVNYVKGNDINSDTLYNNDSGNLSIKRTIKKKEGAKEVDISVLFKGTNKQIISLSILVEL